jgi:very-short-patch-repair endonuclease
MRDPRLTAYAKAMRGQMTQPETRIWLQVRAQRFEGVKFRRQKVVGHYIADFAANEPRLIVEIDGHTHDVDDPHDAARTKYLNERGYHVVRFTNLDVMTNMHGVLVKLSEALESARQAPLVVHAPLPTLSSAGERAQ